MLHLRDIILLILNVQFICLSSPVEQSKSYVTSIFEDLGYSPVCVASTLASCERFVKPDSNPNVPEFITELKSLLQDRKYDIHNISATEDAKKQEKILKLESSEQSSIFYIQQLQNLTLIMENLVTISTAAIGEIKSILNDLKTTKLEMKISSNKIMKNLTTFHYDLLGIKEPLEYPKSLPSKIANVSTSNSDTNKMNCAEDPLADNVTTVYLFDGNSVKSIGVLCDQTTDGGGWTVIQNRIALPEREKFERGWNDYVNGFGDLKGEFWLGLDNIHALTNSTPMELRVDLEDFDGVKKWAKYDLFTIGDESTIYVLTLGKYSGDAGDSLTYHNGMKFSTYDQDNDYYGSGNCALKYRGGWWYKGCHYSNLNGYQYVGKHTSSWDGILWYHFRGENYTYMKASMKIRPKSFN